MQIFELHFNPENKEGRLIDTFCYRPKDVYEKRLGALAIGGELTNDSSNKTLLNNLASRVKGIYHSLPTRTQEEALREGLREGNKFLEESSWRGDLNLAILSIKNNQLQFSKIGEIKILLSRNGQISDIGKNAEESTDIFSSIVSGKIKDGDKLIVLTGDIYKNFTKHDLLIDLAESGTLTNKKLDKISNLQKEKFPKAPGICFLVDFSAESDIQERIVSKDKFSLKKTLLKTVDESQELIISTIKNLKKLIVEKSTFIMENGGPLIRKIYSLIRMIARDVKRALESLLNSAKKKVALVLGKLQNRFNQGNQKSKEKTTKEKSGKLINILSLKTEFVTKKISKIKDLLLSHIDKNPLNLKNKRKESLLIFFFLLIIVIGSIIAHTERQSRLQEEKEKLLLIESQIESINLESENAFEELIQHHQNLEKMLSERIYQNEFVKGMKGDIEEKLLDMSNARIIKDPDIVFESAEIIPRKIEVVNNDIYLYNPLLTKTEKFNLQTGDQLVRPLNFTEENRGVFDLVEFNSEALFFSSPNTLLGFNGLNSKSSLNPPYENYSFQEFEVYKNDFYFLESDTNEIITYRDNDLANPDIWITERRPGNITSFAIDGSIWTLKENNNIWKYENGIPTDTQMQSEQIFPTPIQFEKIKTGPELPLFVLESKEDRVLIFSKNGELKEQVILPNNNNIKDFAVSKNKIYLLENQEVYSIDY